MKYTLPLLLALALGGCVNVNTPNAAPATLSAQSAPGQILYGGDAVIECRYHQGCRTVRQ
ncbi:MAG: hypothetical protein Q4D61_05440 [Cardiobacteriaceae bacterium]|nr:hypothetical protein [Cardiobacteriaceae bacterium]